MADIFTKEAARDFWREQRGRVKAAIAPEGEDQFEFSNLNFPDDPDGKYFDGLEFRYEVIFEKCTFHACLFFRNTTFLESVCFHNSTFSDGVIFSFCDFMGDFDCNDITFNGLTKFLGCNFYGSADFEDSRFDTLIIESEEPVYSDEKLKNTIQGTATFMGCHFGNMTAFRDVQFKNNVSYKKAVFQGKTYFDKTVFESTVSFKDAAFCAAEDRGKAFANFIKCHFKGEADFFRATFDCNVAFTRNIFEDEADLREIMFNREVRFGHNHFNLRLRLEKKYRDSFARAEDAILPYRQAKIAAKQQGESYWEGQFYFQEQCAVNVKNRKRATLNPLNTKFRRFRGNLFCLWLEVLIGRWIFGYGEKSLRPLFAGAIVILIYAAIFFGFGGINYGPLSIDDPVGAGPHRLVLKAAEYPPVERRSEAGPKKDWHYAGNCLYFSVVTFTTLGYGDFQPAPGIPRLLSSSEAVLGAALMAMFIVSLSRRFVR